jgi:hypothetical protein
MRSERTPPGGRIGIPMCRGLHAVSTELYCAACLAVEQQERMIASLHEQTEEIRRGNELKAMEIPGSTRPTGNKWQKSTYSPPAPKKPEIKGRSL